MIKQSDVGIPPPLVICGIDKSVTNISYFIFVSSVPSDIKPKNKRCVAHDVLYTMIEWNLSTRSIANYHRYNTPVVPAALTCSLVLWCWICGLCDVDGYYRYMGRVRVRIRVTLLECMLLKTSSILIKPLLSHIDYDDSIVAATVALWLI